MEERPDGERDHGEEAAGATPLTAVVTPAPPVVDDEVAATRWRFWPGYAMAGVAAALLAFYAYSQTRPPIRFGFFTHPPIYGVWDPTWDRLTLTVIPATLLLAAVGWAITSSRRVPPWLALGAVVGCGVLTAATIALVRGDWQDLIRGVSTDPDTPYYTSDLHYLYELGVRGFVERHPEMFTELHSYNSRTHPPGVHVLLFALFKLFGASHTLRISTAIAVLALSAAVAAWLIGRTLGGERAGRISAVLFVAAPGPLMLAYSSLDLVFAAVLTTAVALFMLAIHHRSAPIAAAAGVVIGLGTLMTFATSFVVLAATVAVVIQTRSVRDAARLLGSAAAGGLVVLTLAWLLLGFDILASYQSLPRARRAYDPYWVLASPSAWLIYAGLPIAALGVIGLFLKVPGARRPVLPLVLVLVMVIWAALPVNLTKLRPGEVERTWAFLYPLVAASAGLVVDRWTRRAGRWSGAIVAGLVVLSVAQAVLLQGLWDNLV